LNLFVRQCVSPATHCSCCGLAPAAQQQAAAAAAAERAECTWHNLKFEQQLLLTLAAARQQTQLTFATQRNQ